MLVQCTGCGISYEHSLRRCVACGAEYVPDAEEKLKLCAADAQRWLEAGAKRLQVHARLTGERGLSEQDADGVILSAQRVLRRQVRQHGRYIAGSGAVLLLIAPGVFLFTGGLILATGCLIVGGAMIVLGLLKAITGWNITGHDDDEDIVEIGPLGGTAWSTNVGQKSPAKCHSL